MIVGVGIDIESVNAFRKKNITKDRHFFEKIFSKSEIQYCKKFSDSAQRFTARFCAKEAAIKATSRLTSLYVSDVEVGHQKNGTPVLTPRSKRPNVKNLFKSHQFHLSLSHTDEWATAIVIMETKGD